MTPPKRDRVSLVVPCGVVEPEPASGGLAGGTGVGASREPLGGTGTLSPGAAFCAATGDAATANRAAQRQAVPIVRREGDRAPRATGAVAPARPSHRLVIIAPVVVATRQQ